LGVGEREGSPEWLLHGDSGRSGGARRWQVRGAVEGSGSEVGKQRRVKVELVTVAAGPVGDRRCGGAHG
jgi:hypothetical protein